MIRVKIFTGESNMSQAEADTDAQFDFNKYLNDNPGVHFVTGQVSISTAHTRTPDNGDWHTCTLAAVMDLPDGGQYS